MPTRVLIGAYDYAIFGALEGQVQEVSADTLADGVERAREAIASGAAHSVMEHYVKRTTELVEGSPA